MPSGIKSMNVKKTIDVQDITFSASYVFNTFADMCSKAGMCPLSNRTCPDIGVKCENVKPYMWARYFAKVYEENEFINEIKEAL